MNMIKLIACHFAGILEVVPDVKSRDEIGKAGFSNLYEYFLVSVNAFVDLSFQNTFC